MTILYHYTCADHGDPGINRFGVILPNRHLHLGASLIWLTDLSEPAREGLGLTSELLSCDRTAIRYEVEADSSCIWWPTWARQNQIARTIREDLERYGLPAHWWVSAEELPVIGRTVRAAA